MSLLAFLFFSCMKKSNGNLDTSVINNPATASGKADKDKLPIMTFEKKTHNFGKLIDGEVIVHFFKFTNTGKSDLIIANVIASCGCTVAAFPKKPIKPGGSDYIEVKFDSKGKSGKFHKNITVYSNTIPNQQEIYIEGNVEKK